MRLYHQLMIICLLLALLSGCNSGREKGILMAPGSYGDVAVIMSDAALAPAVGRFVSAFNDEVTFVIQAESRFNVDIYEPDEWELAKGFKNIIFLLRIGDGGPVEKQLRRMLSEETFARMSAGSGGLAQLDDPFATYQFALVVASQDRNSLLSILHSNAERIRNLVEEKNSWRLPRRFRQDGLNNELTADYWNRFRFFLEIPGEFRQNQLEPDGFPGVELMRNAPSRGITISWTAAADPLQALTEREVLLDLRRRMGEAMHNEELVAESLVWSEEQLGKGTAVKLAGAWNSNAFSGGGPFESYFLADPEGKRVFCIDLLVFAPGMDKMAFFRQLRATAATFSLRRPHP